MKRSSCCNPRIRRKTGIALVFAATMLSFCRVNRLSFEIVYMEDASTQVLGVAQERRRQEEFAGAVDQDPDANCPFRNTTIYRKVYVYPSPGEEAYSGSILSSHGHNVSSSLEQWPWVERDQLARELKLNHYDLQSDVNQFATELLVREILTNPKSCLRTYNPEEAALFYVPYLPSTAVHAYKFSKGRHVPDYRFTPHAEALVNAIEHGDYSGWEKHFGLTSKYWQRRNGSDHIMVYSDPFHGLKNHYTLYKRQGNYHYVNSQKQLRPPIAISVEVSKTFVDMYPSCAAKNILVPYPNTDGRFFNGKYDAEAHELLKSSNVAANSNTLSDQSSSRPFTQFYSAGIRGKCKVLRKAVKDDYVSCSPSHQAFQRQVEHSNSSIAVKHYHGMRQANFCPAPVGDSPSAKRMFDAVLSGCIPVVLSSDFVWPFTNEIVHDTEAALDPADFSIRADVDMFAKARLDPTTCSLLDEEKPDLETWIRDNVLSKSDQFLRLREGLSRARERYGYYSYRNDLPDEPLLEGVLPDGGAAHALVEALAQRANGQMWSACEEELLQQQKVTPRRLDPEQFEC